MSHPIEVYMHIHVDCFGVRAVTATARDVMYDSIEAVPGCAEKLQTCLAAGDHDYKALRFVLDFWVALQTHMLCAILIYLRMAWLLQNSHLHTNSYSALCERKVDGNVAMA